LRSSSDLFTSLKSSFHNEIGANSNNLRKRLSENLIIVEGYSDYVFIEHPEPSEN
jgi:hypothetical protein